MSAEVEAAIAREREREKAAAAAILSALVHGALPLRVLHDRLLPERPFSDVHFSRAFTNLILEGEIALTANRDVHMAGRRS